MTSEQNYEGKGTHANGIDSTAQNNPSAAPATDKAPQPASRPATGDLSLKEFFDLQVNTRGGASDAEVMLWALHEYRQARLKEAFRSVARGEYSEAFTDFNDATTADNIISELALAAIYRADANYWITQGKQPERFSAEDEARARFVSDYLNRSGHPVL